MPYVDTAKKREWEKAWRAKNWEHERLRAAGNRLRQQQTIRAFLDEYLETHPCVDCGEDDIVVLEFDHRFDGPLGAAIANALFSALNQYHLMLLERPTAA